MLGETQSLAWPKPIRGLRIPGEQDLPRKWCTDGGKLATAVRWHVKEILGQDAGMEMSFLRIAGHKRFAQFIEWAVRHCYKRKGVEVTAKGVAEAYAE